MSQDIYLQQSDTEPKPPYGSRVTMFAQPAIQFLTSYTEYATSSRDQSYMNWQGDAEFAFKLANLRSQEGTKPVELTAEQYASLSYILSWANNGLAKALYQNELQEDPSRAFEFLITMKRRDLAAQMHQSAVTDPELEAMYLGKELNLDNLTSALEQRYSIETLNKRGFESHKDWAQFYLNRVKLINLAESSSLRQDIDEAIKNNTGSYSQNGYKVSLSFYLYIGSVYPEANERNVVLERLGIPPVKYPQNFEVGSLSDQMITDIAKYFLNLNSHYRRG